MQMEEQMNNKTLEYYNENSNEYFKNTVNTIDVIPDREDIIWLNVICTKK